MGKKKNTLEGVRAAIAGALGEDPGKVKQIDPKWLRLMKSGVTVDLKIGRWRAQSKLTYGDLGLPEPANTAEGKELDALMNLGRKLLLPAEYLRKFESIESGARNALKKSGFQTYWGTFVAAARYNKTLKPELEKFKAKYFSVAGEMLDNLPELVDRMCDKYSVQARTAFDRLSRINPAILDGFENYDEALTSFVNNFTANVRAQILTREEIEETFYFEWDLNFIPLPDILAEENARAARASQELDRVHEELAHQRRINDIEENTLRQNRREEELIKREIREKAAEAKEKHVTNFMQNMVGQLRGMVYEASTDILQTINNNEGLHPRSVVQIRNLIKAVNEMNFFGDGEVDKMISRIQAELNSVQTGKSDMEPMRNTLAAVATLTRQTLIDIGEAPRSRSDLGVVDVPTEAGRKRARQVLDIEIDPMEFDLTKRRRQPVENDIIAVSVP